MRMLNKKCPECRKGLLYEQIASRYTHEDRQFHWYQRIKCTNKDCIFLYQSFIGNSFKVEKNQCFICSTKTADPKNLCEEHARMMK